MPVDGPAKAAMFLSWLGPQAAAELLREAGQDTVARIAAELAYQDAVGQSRDESGTGYAREFFSLLHTQRQQAGRGEGFVREMIKNVVGEQETPKLMSRVQDLVMARDPFFRMREANVADIADALQGEGAHVASLVLSELPADKSSELLCLLPEEIRAEAVQSLTIGEPVPQETRIRVASVVMRRLQGSAGEAGGGGSASRDDRVNAQLRKSALILRGLTQDLREVMLAKLNESDPQLGKRVEEMMVIWEDVRYVSDRILQEALRSVDSRKLALALVDAEEATVEKIRANISERMAAMMDEEASLFSDVKADDIDGAREPILAALRDINARGELTFEEPEDDE